MKLRVQGSCGQSIHLARSHGGVFCSTRSYKPSKGELRRQDVDKRIDLYISIINAFKIIHGVGWGGRGGEFTYLTFITRMGVDRGIMWNIERGRQGWRSCLIRPPLRMDLFPVSFFLLHRYFHRCSSILRQQRSMQFHLRWTSSERDRRLHLRHNACAYGC